MTWDGKLMREEETVARRAACCKLLTLNLVEVWLIAQSTLPNPGTDPIGTPSGACKLLLQAVPSSCSCKLFLQAVPASCSCKCMLTRGGFCGLYVPLARSSERSMASTKQRSSSCASSCLPRTKLLLRTCSARCMLCGASAPAPAVLLSMRRICASM
jgi:hypothetical protein